MSRVNSIITLVDPQAIRRARTVDGSRTTKNEVASDTNFAYRSFQTNGAFCGSRICQFTEVSSISGVTESTRPETGSNPSMIDLINWGDG